MSSSLPSLLFSAPPAVLIQGLTGKEGQRACEWLQKSGSRITAGVTPGKGGQEVLGVPIYNTVAEALEKHPEISISTMYVPPAFMKAAALEALQAGIKTIHIFAEGLPTKDTVEILEVAQAHSARLVGPSSIGFYRPGMGAVGSIGAGKYEQFPAATLEKPGVALLTKSGGLIPTLAQPIAAAGLSFSFALGCGGDRVEGTTFPDVLPELLADPLTAAIVIAGEIGGCAEEEAAAVLKASPVKKPVVALISGVFAESLPQGVAFGHAGAIVSKTTGTRTGKLSALKDAGALIVDTSTQMTEVLVSLLSGK